MSDRGTNVGKATADVRILSLARDHDGARSVPKIVSVSELQVLRPGPERTKVISSTVAVTALAAACRHGDQPIKLRENHVHEFVAGIILGVDASRRRFP